MNRRTTFKHSSDLAATEVIVADFDRRVGVHSILIAVDRKLCKDSKYLSTGIQFNIQDIAGGLTSGGLSCTSLLPAISGLCLLFLGRLFWEPLQSKYPIDMEIIH